MKPLSSIVVHTAWDEHAKVWVATCEDIDGLALEANTRELLLSKVKSAVSDLISLNTPTQALPEPAIFIRTAGENP